MLEVLTISSDSRFHTSMILTKKDFGASMYSRNWHNNLKQCTSSYFDMAYSEQVVLGYINKMM